MACACAQPTALASSHRCRSLRGVNSASLLEGLDDDQRQAVTCPPSATIVHAGAGSGKTRVLTHRIAWRIAEGSADPARILAITFTREAASEMRRRLRTLGVARNDRMGDVDQPTIGTFHAVALSLLRRRAADTSATMPQIIGNRVTLLEQALGEDPLTRHHASVLTEIDWAHARLVPPERYEQEVRRVGRSIQHDPKRVAAAYVAYERTKRKRGVVDLDDLISLATRAITERSDFAQATRFRYRHLFVDEAQDMNPLQYAFFEAIRGGRSDVFVVGDPMQAIYGWNGAEPTLFGRLSDTMHQATVFALLNNYRCTPQVLEVAARVASHDAALTTTKSEIRSMRSPGVPVEFVEVDDEFDEVDVVRRIVQQHVRGVVTPSVAVLARTNALLEPLSRGLISAGVAVASRRASAARSSAIDEVADCRDRHDLTVWAADVIVDSVDADERIVAEQVQSYLRSSTNEVIDGRGAAAYLRATNNSPERYGVELLTFHAAKGREFSTVIIVGAEAGLMPHVAATTTAQLHEEARLAYVACTRAADLLIIVRAGRRKGRLTTVSPFFASLPSSVHRRGESIEPTTRPRLAPAPDPKRLADDDLRRRLRGLRDHIARNNLTLPEAVLSDAEISRIVKQRPSDTEQLAKILGPLTAQRLGAALLRELQGDAT